MCRRHEISKTANDLCVLDNTICFIKMITMKPRPSPQAILPVDASVHSAREAAAAAARGRASRAPV